MRRIVKNILFLILYAMRPLLGSHASILMYHSVSDSTAFFSVPPKEFERQMVYLARKKYRVIALSDLITMMKQGEDIGGCVAITFDDGYEDFLINALPILRKYTFQATLFLATGLLGSIRRTTNETTPALMMKEEAEKICKEKNIHCMPHTVSHPDLSKVSVEEAIREIEHSRRDVENVSGVEAKIFAYPKGRYTDEVVGYLRKNGWDAAVTVIPGLVNGRSDLFLLPRNAVDRQTSFVQFKGKVSGGIMLYVKLRSLFT